MDQHQNPAGYRILGRTGVRVRAVGFGGCAIGGDHGSWGYGPTDDNESLRAINAALDLGCDLFDTADAYGRGHGERLLGRAMRGAVRDRVLLATKVGYIFADPVPRQDFRPEWLRRAVDAALDRLGTDRIDILQLHNPPPEVVLAQETADTLLGLRYAGKVRLLGVSAASVEDALACLAASWLDTLQVRYSLVAPEAADAVLPAAARLGVAVIAREPLANGYLSGKYGDKSTFHHGDFRGLWSGELKSHLARAAEEIRQTLRPNESLARHAIRWVLASPLVSVTIPGCKTAAQVLENLRP
jgi:aryl-alcohol dehydrogenase-like predicted oxidoreductase